MMAAISSKCVNHWEVFAERSRAQPRLRRNPGMRGKYAWRERGAVRPRRAQGETQRPTLLLRPPVAWECGQRRPGNKAGRVRRPIGSKQEGKRDRAPELGSADLPLEKRLHDPSR